MCVWATPALATRQRGTGEAMTPVPEMAAFSQRFGFTWKAHEIGDANRSAHVERSFYHVGRNFLVGRSFTDLRDLNQQAREWCEAKNASYSAISRPGRSSEVSRSAPALSPATGRRLIGSAAWVK